MTDSAVQEGDLIRLGLTDIQIPALGVGTWQWGDRLWWRYGQDYGEAELEQAFRVALERGLRLFDTAEIYGLGTSERLIGRFRRTDDRVAVATKFFPFPWRLRADALVSALRGSLRRLRLESVDLYQVHWPMPPRPIETWMDGLGKAANLGLTRAVGVSNFNRRQTERAARRLRKHAVHLASNQVAYSLLNRSPERNGVLETCKNLGVSVIAYSPLAMGILSGKYSAANPPSGVRRRRFPPERLQSMEPLLSTLRRIALERDRTPSQVSLNWLICKGAIPIPGAKSAAQVEENAGALGWRLSSDEILELDETSARVERVS